MFCTFSSSCLSSFVQASHEHMVYWGATTVQIPALTVLGRAVHLPALLGVGGQHLEGAEGKGMGENKRMGVRTREACA